MILPPHLRGILLTLALACTVPALAQTAGDKQKAQDAYVAGARMLDRRDYAAAEKQFSRALVLAPANPAYLAALALAREHHVSDLVQQAGRERMLGHAPQAEALVAQARALDPTSVLVAQHETAAALHAPEAWLSQPPVYAGAISLSPTAARRSFHLHTDLQQVLREVAAGYGLRVIADSSVQSQSVRFDLDDVTYGESMPILLQMGHLFAVPLDPTSILVARDTADNRQRLERQMQETIYVPAMTNEQLSDLGNLVRNVFDIRQATIENSLGTMVLRAPEATLKAVNLTLADLLDSGSEVLLELKLYSVDTSRNRTTGATLPQQIGGYNVAGEAQKLVTANQSTVDQAIAQGLIPATATAIQIAAYLIASGVATSSLLSGTLGIFGGGITTTGVYTSTGVSLNFGLTSGDTRALDQIQLRVGDRQPATFRIGSRYPITTATYSTGSAALPSSLAGITINGVSAASLLSQFTGSGTTVPQIQYEDIGLTLKATPTITKLGAVNIKLDFKVEALSGGSNNNIPILNNRQLVSDVTVADGATALVLSNLNRSEARAISGVPGLSDLPGFQSASDQTVQADTSQLVLLLTPHIVRHRADTVAGPRIRFKPSRTVAAN